MCPKHTTAHGIWPFTSSCLFSKSCLWLFRNSSIFFRTETAEVWKWCCLKIGFDFYSLIFFFKCLLSWTVAFFIFLFTWKLWIFSGPICENTFCKLNLKAEGIVQTWGRMGKLSKAKGNTEVSESNEGRLKHLRQTPNRISYRGYEFVWYFCWSFKVNLMKKNTF